MSSPALQRWLTEHLIRRAQLAAIETLLADGPVLPHETMKALMRSRRYTRRMRTDPELQGVRDLYACLRRSPEAILTLGNGATISPRRVWKRVRRHLHAMPSELFGMLSDHPQVDWVATHMQAGGMLEDLAESESDATRMEGLYSLAAAFYGAAAMWVRELARAGALSVRELDPATQRKLEELGKYAPWLHQGRFTQARTTAEAEESRQAADIRRQHARNAQLMPEFLRQFFQGGATR